MVHPFRFGIQLTGPAPGLTWGDTARKLEDTGWSTLVMPDHFGDQLAVAPALAVAAEATTSLRLGALVFGNDYRHPVVLAKDMATLDVVSEGRMELGLGAGWMRTDYDQAGMSYDRPGQRIERMLESLAVIRGMFATGPFDFAGEHYTITAMEGWPKPVQASPPLLIGGGARRMLGVAAREADIVGVTANLSAGEVGADAIADITAERFDEKLTWVREAAGDRFDHIELNVLVMSTQVTDDRAAAIEGTAALFGMPPEAVAETPILLIGSTAEIVDTLLERRERWGFSYVIVQDHDSIDALAPVVAELTGT
ncbi:MAG: TIGR03621 family F420-dependent LLM class oxidoreductase [Acidimicrobiales bacterium]